MRNKRTERMSTVAIFIVLLFPALGCTTYHDASETYYEEKKEPGLPDYEPDVWIAPSSRDPTALDGGSLDSPPKLTNPQTPEYPVLALRAGIQGIIVFDVIVGTDGKVEEIETVSSDATYTMKQSALDTIRKFIYLPGTRKGKPIACRVEIPIHFCVR